MLGKTIILCFMVATCLAVFDTDPDAGRSIFEIIESRNLVAETHYVTTDDGYILGIHRIVDPMSKTEDKRPVICQHGLESSSIDWLINSPEMGIEFSTSFFNGTVVGNNLGFALIMHGYDVWLPNSRGNIFSRNHTKLDVTNKEFWKFSFDEMIEYDLPAVIKYILKYTNRSTLGYVGHSQGTEIMFGLLSEKPEYSEIVQPAVMLAPVARINHMKSAMRIFTAPLVSNLLEFYGGKFLESIDEAKSAMSEACRMQIAAEYVCSSVMFLICGFDSNHMNHSRLHVYVAHSTAGTSTQNILHYVNNFKLQEFRKYDYGDLHNIRKYGTKLPPLYDLKKINSTSITLIYSDNDWLADPEDVKFIINEIGENLKIVHRIPLPKWNHLDFMYGLNSSEFVNTKVLEMLSQYIHLA